MNLFKRIYIHIPEIGKLIRSFIFCFRYLPFKQALKMPIFLAVPVVDCRALTMGEFHGETGVGTGQIAAI